jgi:four helix bundle protein
MTVNSYKELIVWQKSILFVKQIYKLTRKFPKSETFALTSQIQRASVSIPSNIAEGYGRRSHNEYLQFYSISYGSTLEVETQLIISKELGYITEEEFDEVHKILDEVVRMLFVMVYKR